MGREHAGFSARTNWHPWKKSRYSTKDILLFSLLLVVLSRLAIYLCFEGYAAATGDGRDFLDALNIWDAEWYRGITEQGYTSPADYGGGLVNWAFFPLFSLAVRGAQALVPLPAYVLGFALNTAFQTAALAFLLRYVPDTRGEKGAAQAVFVCVLLTFGCYSFYFASYYTEALYLMLTAGALYFLHRRQYLACGVFGFFLALARSTGVVLLAGMLAQMIADYCAIGVRGQGKSVRGFLRACLAPPGRLAGLLLVPAGLAAFMVFLWLHVGDPLAFLHAQSAWGGGVGNPFANIATGLASGEARQVFFAVCASAGIAVGVFLLWEGRHAEGVMALALVLIPVSVRLQSIPRYLAGNVVFLLGFSDAVFRCTRRHLRIAVCALACAAEFALLFLWFGQSTFLW